MATDTTKSKRNFGSSSWTYRWSPLKNTEPTGNYFHGQNHESWERPITGYHEEFLQNQASKFKATDNKSSMANFLPWLMSVSLIGAQNFGALSRPDDISQELQAPLIETGYRDTLVRQFEKPGINSERLHTNPACLHAERGDLAIKTVTSLSHNGGYPKEIPTVKLNYPQPLPDAGLHPLPADKILGSFQNGIETGVFHHVSNSNLREINFQPEPYKTSHKYIPPETKTHEVNDYAGPAMEMVYSWKTVDFNFGSEEARELAIIGGSYVPENNLPLGLEVWRDKIFLTLPRWKKGIPATLVTVPKYSDEKSPKLTPYPNWEWHNPDDCQGLTSVFRVQVDECDRLWVLDSGQVDVTSNPKQICPPELFIFDLKTDQLIRKFSLPPDQIKEDSLYSNLAVDVRGQQCNKAVAYLTDVWRFGIVVYDFFTDESFRIQHHFFFPDPLASRYELHGVHFQWTDGLFGVALSPIDVNNDRTLFFHPMSSFREFAVPTSILRDEKIAEENAEKFIPIGKPRAKDSGHSSGSAMDRNGVLFFNMVTRDSVWCWDSRKEYIPRNLGVVGQNNVTLIFPNDIKVDHEADQSMWVLSNKLPMFLYGYLKEDEVNFRLYKANVREAVKNTVCDPNYVVPPSEGNYDETC